tara:strand:- start:31956 stop:32150 length:195 start_codon:yes stop_codon:yes gene_type:complete
MKIFIYIILALSTALLIFNLTKIDYNTPFEGNSTVAVISVLACACAIVLLLILQVSKKIAQKQK